MQASDVPLVKTPIFQTVGTQVAGDPLARRKFLPGGIFPMSE
jgi:hypothetical protein